MFSPHGLVLIIETAFLPGVLPVFEEKTKKFRYGHSRKAASYTLRFFEVRPTGFTTAICEKSKRHAGGRSKAAVLFADVVDIVFFFIVFSLFAESLLDTPVMFGGSRATKPNSPGTHDDPANPAYSQG